MPPSPPSSSSGSAVVRPAAGFVTWRRLVKWFVWSISILTVLAVLFLTLPGIECSWRFPENSGSTWIELRREKGKVMDTRVVALGRFRVRLIFIGGGHLPSRGPRWGDGAFAYNGNNWQFHLRVW